MLAIKLFHFILKIRVMESNKYIIIIDRDALNRNYNSIEYKNVTRKSFIRIQQYCRENMVLDYKNITDNEIEYFMSEFYTK